MNQQIFKAFFSQFPTRTYPKNHSCLPLEQKTDFFYFIESGSVKMVTTAVNGNNLVVHILFPQNFFSLLSLVGDEINHYEFITLETTTLRKVPKSELIDFLKQNPEAMYDLQLRLLRAINGLVLRLSQTAFNSAYNQTASILLYFSRHFSQLGSHHPQLTIKLTHQEIADWLGTTRETVSIQMKELERNNIIRIKDHLIQILDLAELKKIANHNTSI